jgi:hypothetical protein
MAAGIRRTAFFGPAAKAGTAKQRNNSMTTITPIEKMTSPLGRQVIELQQLDHAGGGMSLLRTRIREGSRFTVFEVDPQTALQWGEALVRWARAQPTTVPQTEDPV